MFRSVAQVARSSARSFSTGRVVRKDFIQELYVKEIKAFKPKPASSSQGAAKAYSTPAAPKAPEVPDAAGLAKELESYDASSPSLETPTASADAVSAEEADNLGADEYLRLCEEPVKVEAKH
ncbi:hypothetical protein JCM10207_002618 [Rhodosporidiobolus poonsookiae]